MISPLDPISAKRPGSYIINGCLSFPWWTELKIRRIRNIMDVASKEITEMQSDPISQMPRT